MGAVIRDSRYPVTVCEACTCREDTPKLDCSCKCHIQVNALLGWLNGFAYHRRLNTQKRFNFGGITG